MATRILGDFEVSGALGAGAVEAESLKGSVGIEAPYFKGSVRGAVQKSLSANATISEDAIYYGITLSAASKVVTLDRAEGTVCFVMNEGGTNAFTLKNVSGDTGTSIAAGKIALVVCSRTANKTAVAVLN